MATTSQSMAEPSNSQRFNDCLNHLQEEFESNVASIKSSNARRFNIYLSHLKDEFELICVENESLRKERDGYKVKVGNSNFCERCSNEITTNSQMVVSRPVNLIQETTTSTQKPPLLISPIQSSQSRPVDTEVEKELDVVLAYDLDHEGKINFLKFSQDGKSLAAGYDNDKVYIYDVETGRLTCVLGNLLKDDECIGGAVCFSGDGKYLATDTWSGNIYTWDVQTKYIRNVFRGHSDPCTSLEFSPDGRLLLSSSRDNTVRLRDMRGGSEKSLAENNLTFIDRPCYTHANFSPDGKYVAASHRDGIVRIWGVRTGRLMRRVKSDSIEWASGVKFMPDGKGLLSSGANWAGDNAVLEFWDISSLNATQFHAKLQTTNGPEELTRPERVFLGHKHYIISLSVSHNGMWVASGSSDNSVRIWNTRNAVPQCILEYVHKTVLSVDFSPAGGYLASGGRGGLVKIWKYTDMTDGKSQGLPR